MVDIGLSREARMILEQRLFLGANLGQLRLRASRLERANPGSQGFFLEEDFSGIATHDDRGLRAIGHRGSGHHRTTYVAETIPTANRGIVTESVERKFRRP